ncbi:sugar O-acetyltransferase [Corynebacterium sp. BF-R-2]|uniref:sugar O-acetyltransferase n=1 Tax=Corynebacterium sp. BF-R-2 TaxID=2943494 RepID=UPI00211E0FC8|nr:sugar O-acetyltransferase [Corynebacterium sp. BF-R-2]MCQ9677678.1 sugar O-acetyltransferase [Corynebacterium sp. BF-R-2]
MTHPDTGSFERMASGQCFMPGVNEEVRAEHQRGFRLVKELNELQNTDHERAKEILRALLSPESEIPGLHAPLNLEFGRNVTVGRGVFINFGATILAQAPISLGDRVMIGPNCSLITVGHPVDDHRRREEGWEIAKPISVGRNTWFGANVTVLPGVTIGEDCVVGANTLVTTDIPDKSLVLGSPGRVVRTLENNEDAWERKDLDV